MRVLKDEVLNNGIQVLEHSPAVELLIDPDRGMQQELSWQILKLESTTLLDPK